MLINMLNSAALRLLPPSPALVAHRMGIVQTETSSSLVVSGDAARQGLELLLNGSCRMGARG
jgi:hypothetical protein